MNKRNLVAGAIAALILSASYPALADDSGVSVGGLINFDALDTDRDGVLTEIEFDQSGFFKGQDFGDVDKNNDGSITGEELSLWANVNGKGNAVGSRNTVGIINPYGTRVVPVPLQPLAPVPPATK